ncbi:DUF429 domain-containing protein [Desulfovibrio inopinatus]|uniref:DUF429 domain-containing protein n=1 Tax=Desulfovibrio inopinatus TaxID=102109 RepID=UPI00041A818C|nr:DUF429 domain-containing protein [Desulfovibrio inopinatus]
MIYAIGIDVAANRKGQTVAVADLNGTIIQLDTGRPAVGLADALIAKYGTNFVVAIDGPRMPTAPKPGPSGRECERELVRNLGVRIQWSPKADDTPRLAKLEWMRNSFTLFQDFTSKINNPAHVIEVFPTAVYTVLDAELTLHVPVRLLSKRDKADQLDAMCCAAVGLLHHQGRTQAFGRGDPEGEIIVPLHEGNDVPR